METKEIKKEIKKIERDFFKFRAIDERCYPHQIKLQERLKELTSKIKGEK